MSAPLSPSGDAPREPPGPPWRLIGVVAAILVARLAIGAATHLTEDEAYYRLWSMAPAFGYYDHPPMIAWWMWLGRAVAADTPLGARLLSTLSCAAISLIVFDLVRLAGADRRTAERAGLWYNAMLLVAVGGFLAVPDAPAALFWAVTLWCALRAVRADSWPWWLAAGVAAGLAALSKYSALFLGPGMLVWLAATPAGRRQLRTAGPWLALLAAAAVFSVNVAWNAEHRWVTFARQFGRIAPTRLAPRYLVEFMAGQAILLNPLVALFVVRALARKPAPAPRQEIGLFIATSAPFIGYLFLHSLHDRVQAHWPAPVYPALAILAAFAARRTGEGRGWRLARAAVGPVALTTCIAAVVVFSLPSLGVPLAGDPALAVRGWPAFARRIETLRIETASAWVGTTSYGLAAELADERASTAPIVQISERARWEGLDLPAPDLGRPGVIIDLERRIDLGTLRACFAHVQMLGRLERGSPAEPGALYVAVRVGGPRRDVFGAGCGDKRKP